MATLKIPYYHLERLRDDDSVRAAIRATMDKLSAVHTSIEELEAVIFQKMDPHPEPDWRDKEYHPHPIQEACKPPQHAPPGGGGGNSRTTPTSEAEKDPLGMGPPCRRGYRRKIEFRISCMLDGIQTAANQVDNILHDL